MRIIVDFDSTIALSEWPEIHGPVPGAIQALKYIHKKGNQIVIWSARNNLRASDPVDRARGLHAMKDFLDSNEIPYDEIDYGHEGKPIGDCYVDDRALGAPTREYKGKRVIDWTVALAMIRLLSIRSRLDR